MGIKQWAITLSLLHSVVSSLFFNRVIMSYSERALRVGFKFFFPLHWRSVVCVFSFN